MSKKRRSNSAKAKRGRSVKMRRSGIQVVPNRASKPKYGPKEIKLMVDDGTKSLEQDGLAPEDPWLYVAAAHALDLYDVAKGTKQGFKLSFTVATQENLLPVVMISSMQLISQDKPAEEAREITAKRLAAYLMFQVYNDLFSMGFKVDFDCSDSSYALVAETAEGVEHRFDFLANAFDTVDGFMLNGPAAGMTGGGTLQPYYQQFYEELLLPLFKSKGMV